MSRESVVLIDTSWDGHHETYFKSISKAFLDLNYEVWAFCPEPARFAAWAENNLDSFRAESLKIKAMCPIAPKINSIPDLLSNYHSYFLRQGVQALSLWITMQRAISTMSMKHSVFPKLVFFPNLDSLMSGLIRPSLLDKIFTYRWSGVHISPLYLRVNHDSPNLGKRLYNNVFKTGFFSPAVPFLSKNCVAVGTLDENITHHLENRVNRKVLAFPDITDESLPDLDWQTCKEIIERSRGRKIVSLLGGVMRRKGVFTFIEVTKRLKDVFFVLAGPLLGTEDENAFLRGLYSKPLEYENLYSHFEHIPDGPKFNALVKICDAVFAAYQNHHQSSNLLTKAALFGKPVLVSRGSLMEERVNKHEIGIAVEQNNVNEATEAVKFLLNDFWSVKKPKFKEYFENHSQHRLLNVLSNILSLA